MKEKLLEQSLIKTKLFIPPAPPELVRRPRLLDKIQAALNHKLTLVSAPAGFGKTTLLSEWIHDSQPPAPTAWLSLEEADLERFHGEIYRRYQQQAPRLIPWRGAKGAGLATEAEQMSPEDLRRAGLEKLGQKWS